jgi:hypothetical protein
MLFGGVLTPGLQKVFRFAGCGLLKSVPLKQKSKYMTGTIYALRKRAMLEQAVRSPVYS